MSQSDFQIDNVSRSLFRTENNEALQALASLSSGATEPATPYAYQLWADTTSGLLKQRNAANNAWIAKGSLSAVNWGFAQTSGGTYTGDIAMSASAIYEAEGAAVASAATTNIWAGGDGNTVHVTGNTGPITSFGTAPQAGAWMKVIFDSTPLLTQSANLNLNAGGSNITIEAGDMAFVYADTTTQFDVFVIRKSGSPITGATNSSISQGNSSVAVTDAGTGKIERTVDGTIISEETVAARRSTIDGGSTLYPEFKCRAWVNFNGTGTVAIRASGNVSSVTDNGVGDYTVNFTTAMPDANYAPVISCGNDVVLSGIYLGAGREAISAPTTSAYRFGTLNNGTFTDLSRVYAAFLR